MARIIDEKEKETINLANVIVKKSETKPPITDNKSKSLRIRNIQVNVEDSNIRKL